MRLTNSMRDDIVRRVLKFKFEAPEKALKAEGNKLFGKIYDLLLGEHKAAIEKMPAHWFPQLQSFVVDLDDATHVIEADYPRRLPGNLPRRFDAVKHRTRTDRAWSWSTDEAGDYKGVFKLLEPHARKLIELDAEREALRAKLKALVYSVTTVKKLYEVWPELAEIVPMPEDTTNTGTALTVSVADLNKAIPLPSKKVGVRKGAKK